MNTNYFELRWFGGATYRQTNHTRVFLTQREAEYHAVKKNITDYTVVKVNVTVVAVKGSGA